MSSPELIAGRYRIISQLGEGGMGVAYRAWDNEHDVPVVVKMPKADKESDSDFIERFNREIKAMAGLAHPHIVPVVGYGQDIDGRPYVAMRFLPGGSLSDRRRRGPDKQALPSHPSLLHQWLPSISDALDVVHRAGLVHRDVKPDNIFFDARWNAFLGDFGVAKVVNAGAAVPKDETITKTGIAVGTYAYMAPEVWSNRPVAASDQYSLAVAVYEMLAGMRPFTGEFGEIARGHIIDHPPPLLEKQPQLPSRVCEAVHRALAKKPEDRFGTCAEFAAAVLEGVPAPLRKEGVTRVMCPACRVMLDLDEKVAGKSGKCKTCSASVKVAANLESVWLLGESQAAVGQGDDKPPKTPSTFGNTDRESSDGSTASRSLKSVVLTDIVVPPAVIALVPEQVARTLGIFPVKVENGILQVAIGDPVVGEPHEMVRAKLKNSLVEFLYAPEWEIATAIRQHYTKQRDPLLTPPVHITEKKTAAGGSDARHESLGEEMWRKHEQPRLTGVDPRQKHLEQEEVRQKNQEHEEVRDFFRGLFGSGLFMLWTGYPAFVMGSAAVTAMCFLVVLVIAIPCADGFVAGLFEAGKAQQGSTELSKRSEVDAIGCYLFIGSVSVLCVIVMLLQGRFAAAGWVSAWLGINYGLLVVARMWKSWQQ